MQTKEKKVVIPSMQNEPGGKATEVIEEMAGDRIELQGMEKN